MAMGVDGLSLGEGVRVAVLDSGTPPPYLLSNGPRCGDDFFGHEDSCGHATAVSSILFGGGGITGLCPKATRIFIKVLDSGGVGSVATVSSGIRRAVEMGADIINLSLGFARTSSCPSELEEACREARESGIAVVCAAGNDGGPVNWPAALGTTLCVGSVSKNGDRASFSSTGEVDFVTFGDGLPVLGLSGGIQMAYGTSFSAAIATGLCAIIMSGARKDGRCPVRKVFDGLMAMSKDLGDPGWDDSTGFGVLYGGGRFREAKGRSLRAMMDPALGMKIRTGVFGKIVDIVRGLFGPR